MNIMQVKTELRGPVIPVISNTNSDLTIDHEGIKVNVRFMVERGIRTGQGILLAVGAGGDFPMLNTDERKAVGATIVDAAAGEVPVIVGVQDTDLKKMIELAQHAESVGAYGIQLSPTFYYASSEGDFLRLCKAIHDATDRVAIMVYNTPWNGYGVTLDQLGRLAEFPRILLIKWSTELRIQEYMKAIHRFSDRFAFIDNQGMHVMNHILGGTGYITHLATIWPEHDVELNRLLEMGDYPNAQRMIAKCTWPWQAFRGKMCERTGSESPVVRAALEIVGRPGGPCHPPTRDLTDEERAEFRELLVSIGVPGLD